MKTYATVFKNIAALIMMIALISLLLPFLKITTPAKDTTISGLKMVKVGAEAGYEYYKHGNLDENYVIAGDLTWGELKADVAFAMQQDQMEPLLFAGALASLPILFCFLAMIFTFMAIGKKTMVLPTLSIGWASIQSMFMLLTLLNIRNYLMPNTEVLVLIGGNAFIMLCVIAFLILLFLWITGGFRLPVSNEDEVESNASTKDKKNWFSNRHYQKGKHLGGRREKKKSKKKSSKKKSKKVKEDNNSKQSKETSNNENAKKAEQYNETSNSQNSKDVHTKTNSNSNAKGSISGLSGYYQGAKIGLANGANHTFTIGTSPEAVNALMRGKINNLKQVAGNNCVISYNGAKEQYMITSHSMADIILKSDGGNGDWIRLRDGESKSVGANTLLCIEDDYNCIRLN